MLITACLSCRTTGGPDKERSAAARKLTGRIRQGPKGRPTSLPESSSPECILAEGCTHHQEGPWVRPNMGQARWLARDSPETNPITTKPEAVSHVAEHVSWGPSPCCSPPGRPFPIKSFALSARVSPRTIPLRALDKSPLSGPGRDTVPLCLRFRIDSVWVLALPPPARNCCHNEWHPLCRVLRAGLNSILGPDTFVVIILVIVAGGSDYSPHPSTLPHILWRKTGGLATPHLVVDFERRGVAACHGGKNHKPCRDHLPYGTKVISCWRNRRKPVTPRVQMKTHGDGGREETSPLPVM